MHGDLFRLDITYICIGIYLRHTKEEVVDEIAHPRKEQFIEECEID